MDTLTFLQKILPENGLKVVAVFQPLLDENKQPVVDQNGKQTFIPRHKTFATFEEMAEFIRIKSFSSYNIFQAMGGYDPKESFIEKERPDGSTYRAFARRANFTTHFRSVWIDIDCGEDKAANNDGYVDHQTALAELDKFIAAVDLVEPMVVLSGKGLHVYWTFTDDITATDWEKIAKNFERVVKHYGLLADPACTTDKARILRPLGTINQKHKARVTLLRDAPSTSAVEFVNSFKPYYMEHKEELKQIATRNTNYSKPEHDFPKRPRKVKQLMERCQAIRYCYFGDEPVSEPVWRGVLSVLRLCDNSGKHIETIRERCERTFPETSRFKEKVTYAKVDYLTANETGPHTCSKFNEICPKLCAGCPHYAVGAVTTPLTLAEHYEKLPPFNPNLDISHLQGDTMQALSNEQASTKMPSSEVSTAPMRDDPLGDGQDEVKPIPDPPYPFFRTVNGLVEKQRNGDSEQEKAFFVGDIVPIMTKFIEVVDNEPQIIVKYRIRVGLTGPYQEVSFPMKEWYAADKMKQRLGAIGISISEEKMKTLLRYLRAYQGAVGDQMTEIKQQQHFGWVEDEQQFLLGETLFQPDGAVTVTPHASMKGYLRYFKTKGTLQGWQALMDRLEMMGAVEQQVCVLSSLAATLMRFTNYNGIWFHLMTKPGYGKTTTQEMMNGIWGKPQDLLLNAKDTINAIEERFGRWCNVGVTIDELSNLDPKIISDLVLGVTQGRTKRRLDSSMRERVDDLSWNLTVLSSGNFSLVDIINRTKADVAAEISRTLEFHLPRPTLSVYEGEKLIKTPIRENYGVAGYEWLRKLVRIPERKIKGLIDLATEKFSSHLIATSDERFWVTACAVVYAAGQLANRMGLLNWNLDRIFDTLCNIVNMNRGNRTSFEFSAVDLLTSFLSESIRNTLVIDNGIGEGAEIMKMMPVGELNVRYEMDKGLLYIRNSAFKEYCHHRNIGFNAVKQSLDDKGVLVDVSKRIIISKGMVVSTGRVYCMVLKVDDLIKGTMDGLLVDDCGLQQIQDQTG